MIGGPDIDLQQIAMLTRRFWCLSAQTVSVRIAGDIPLTGKKNISDCHHGLPRMA